ncbi:phosphorylase family protein [Cystoisospora suis]|uniref:Phosphorylase family protein n=1 Tax=Cystoisospora suis TaxID=483139 RepID=A0A2C6L679_9APIC|nr:phosphorylase family protein [Cystoisospora suis]
MLAVGSEGRALFLATRLLKDPVLTISPRRYCLHTGTYKGTQVTIVCTGMGAPAMDFLIREAGFVLDGGNLAVIRLGTCGIIDRNVEPGTLMICDRSSYCYRNYAHFDGILKCDDETSEVQGVHDKVRASPYVITAPLEADKELTDWLEQRIKEKGLRVKRGLNCSAETFYSCQGRLSPDWYDENEKVLDQLIACGAVSVEMETHQLFHLMRHRTRCLGRSRAASVLVGLVNRVNPSMANHVSAEDEEMAVLAAGEAALDALVSLCDPESVSYNRQQTPVDVAALPPALKPDSWNGV